MNETQYDGAVRGSSSARGTAGSSGSAGSAGSSTGSSANPRRNWTEDSQTQANAVVTPQPIKQPQRLSQPQGVDQPQETSRSQVTGRSQVAQRTEPSVPQPRANSTGGQMVQRTPAGNEVAHGGGVSEAPGNGPSRAMREYDAATREYKRVNGEYQSRVKKAESALNRAKKEHADAVADARKLVEREKNEYGQPVARFAHATLYVDRIEYNHAKLRLDSGQASVRVLGAEDAVRASIDYPRTESGGRSAKLANKVMGEDDSAQQLFLEVWSGNDVMLVQFAAKDEQEARSFGSRIVTGALNYDSARANHEERLANFESNVDRVNADVATIEQAQARLADAKADTHELESARTRVDFTRAAVPTLELEQRRRAVRKRNTIAIVALVVVAVVVIGALWWFTSH